MADLSHYGEGDGPTYSTATSTAGPTYATASTSLGGDYNTMDSSAVSTAANPVTYATAGGSVGSASTLYRPPKLALVKMPRAERVPYKNATICQCCKETKFSMFNGKRHCKACGHVVCGKCTQRRHPLHKSMVICRHCYSKGMVESYHMHDCGWYHGPLTRAEAEGRLKDSEAIPGDYLVRESAGVDGFLALSVLGEEQGITHYLINVYRDLFYVGTNRLEPGADDQLFDSIEAMMDSEVIKRLCRLRRAVIVQPPEDETCPRCRFQNETTNTLFCAGCGTRLNSTAAQRTLYYTLGTMMRSPTFNKSSIDNPAYHSTLPEESEGAHYYGSVAPVDSAGGMVNANYDSDKDYYKGPAASAAADDGLYNNMDEEPSLFTELDRTHVTLGPRTGQSYLGPVHKGTLLKDGAKLTVTVKVLGDKAEEKGKEAFLNEISKIAQARHANVVAMLGACTTAAPLMLVTEHCSEGSLDELLRAGDSRLDEKTKISLLLDLASGLEYIAGLKIVHRDVAARNCLITQSVGTTGARLVGKLGDLGMAREVAEDYYVSTGEGEVARRWAAPEVLCFRSFSSSSDVWAFGLTVLEAFQSHPGSQPFYFIPSVAKLGETLSSAKSAAGALAELLKELARGCPGDVAALVAACLSYEKQARPVFGDIVQRLTDALEGTARWDFPRKNLKMVKLLGSGAFGKVERHVAVGLGPQPLDVAVKSCTDPQGHGRFLQEIDIMKTVRHPHIVRMLAACIAGGPPLMVLEFMPGGSLDHFLRVPKAKLSPTDLQTMAFQVATAMAYIVSRQLVHRDLSARNCLVSLPLSIKLADFGLARETEESLYEMSTNTNIPVRWTAPECFRTRTFSEATDVFSFGVLLWEIYTYPFDQKKPYKHAVPYNELSDAQFVAKLRIDALPPLEPAAPPAFITPLIKSTLTRCRQIRPEARPTFDELATALAPFKD